MPGPRKVALTKSSRARPRSRSSMRRRKRPPRAAACAVRGREGVPQMQIARWTGREAGDNHGLQSERRTVLAFGQRLLNGPRLAAARGAATHLVVLCHGYGADGNDLIGLAPHWQQLSADRGLCRTQRAGALPWSPVIQWFPISRVDPQEVRRGVEAGSTRLRNISRCGTQAARPAAERLDACGIQPGHDVVPACGTSP